MEQSSDIKDPAGEPFRHWLADAEVQAERARLQVEIVLRELPGAVAAYKRPSGGGAQGTPELDYLYRGGRVLVRDQDRSFDNVLHKVTDVEQ